MAPPVSAARRACYALLSNLPGRRGLRYLRKLSRARHDEVQAAFEAALTAAEGRVCIDLGANIGVYSRRMAEVARKVYAFEPDPWTAAELRTHLQGHDNVEVIEAAAGAEAGCLPLYRSGKFDSDPQKGSLSSTLVAGKSNVTGTAVAEVEVRDFPAFLRALDSDVALLKIDIEGAEVALLEALLDDPVAQRIDHIFVETHETKLPPDLARRSRALRRRVAGMTHPRVDMDWL
jgi:FkbM family methyltransferase